jgi:hypothetical protein
MDLGCIMPIIKIPHQVLDAMRDRTISANYLICLQHASNNTRWSMKADHTRDGADYHPKRSPASA